MKFSTLPGHHLTGLSVSEPYLALHLQDTPAWWLMDGDCCSETFLYHVDGVEALGTPDIPAWVLEVDTVDWDSAADCTRQESDEVSFVKIRTSLGFCTLEFRNSSNGYYGGEVNPCEPPSRATQTSAVRVTADF